MDCDAALAMAPATTSCAGFSVEDDGVFVVVEGDEDVDTL